MKLKDISADEKDTFLVESASVQNRNEELLTKLAENQRLSDEIKKQLSLEKARADRLQKKVQFIQDNQDLFNHLKDAYVNMRDSRETPLQDKEIQDEAIQTNAVECLKHTASSITAVSKRDLAEVTQLVKELKNVVSKGGKRIFAMSETDQHLYVHQLKQLEQENQQLKRELSHKTSELDRLRVSSGTGPREVSLLRRIVAKILLNGTDLSSLSNRESVLARTIAKKYEQRRLESERKACHASTEQDEEVEIAVTPFETPRTPHTPQTTKDVYSTPRWIRGEDVP